MSSTKRGSIREVSDYYVTPAWLVDEFLQKFGVLEPDLFLKLKSSAAVLDPCAGGSDSDVMAYPEGLVRAGVPRGHISTVDICEDSLAEYKGNYLEVPLRKFMEDEPGPSLIISNPPFANAIEFIQKGLAEVAPGGWVVMLCRLNFLGSRKRAEFFHEAMPRYVVVHSKRPSFGARAITEKAKTDSIEYAHFCWKEGDYRDRAELFLV